MTRLRGAVVLLFVCACPAPAYCASSSQSHQVTIVVPQVNEISADASSFTLTFPDYLKGSETGTQEVRYTVKGNRFGRGSGVIQARLNAPIAGVEVQADVGSYSKQGGNASLVETSPGFVALGSEWVNLCDLRPEGGSGNVAYGTLPVSYKAVARDDLAAREVTVEVSIVLADL